MFLGLMVFVPGIIIAQLEISGPVCVHPGIVYDYRLLNNANTADLINVCVRNGKIQDNPSDCISVKQGGSLKIIWAVGKAGSISLKNDAGKPALIVNISNQLDPGTIPDSLSKQIRKALSRKSKIICHPASGGGCSPIYTYQWEYSLDAFMWVSLRGATDKDLPEQFIMDKPIFYRRKVVEGESGTIAYSNISTVFYEVERK